MIAILPDGREIRNFCHGPDEYDNMFGPGTLTWGEAPVNGIKPYYTVHYTSVTEDGEYLRFAFDSEPVYAYSDDVSKPLESLKRIGDPRFYR